MSSLNTGGPAFPTPEESPSDEYPGGRSAGDGMSLRDYFAAKALAGLIANNPKITDGDASSRAYALADAMIKRRSIQAG